MPLKTTAVSRQTKRIPTDEELMNLPKDGYKRELLDGEIVLSPAGSAHGRKIMRFSFKLIRNFEPLWYLSRNPFGSYDFYDGNMSVLWLSHKLQGVGYLSGLFLGKRSVAVTQP